MIPRGPLEQPVHVPLCLYARIACIVRVGMYTLRGGMYALRRPIEGAETGWFVVLMAGLLMRSPFPLLSGWTSVYENGSAYDGTSTPDNKAVSRPSQDVRFIKNCLHRP